MFKKIMAVAVAVALAASLAACKGGGKTGSPSATSGQAAPAGKAYTQQTFDGAKSDGLVGAAMDSAGELLAVQQASGQAATVTTYDAAGKKKATVTTDVTDTVSLMALGPNDAVYLLAQPQTGLQTVHVLDASGKTSKTIALAGMQVTQQSRGGANASAAADTATPGPSATPSASATRSRSGNGGFGGGQGGGFNMRSLISAMQVAPDGSVLVSAMGSGILVFDAAGKQTRTIGDNSSFSAVMAINGDGQLLVYSSGRGSGSASLKTYDPASGSQIASVDVSGVSGLQYLFYDKAGKRLLYMTSDSVRVLGTDGKDAGQLVSLSTLSLLNGARSFKGFAVDAQGTVYMTDYNSDNASSSSGSTGGGGMGAFFAMGGGAGAYVSQSANEILRLGLVDASTLKAKTTITMVSLNENRILERAVSVFQLANPDYLINYTWKNTQVQGYARITGGGGGGSQFDNSALVQALNTDLMSGKGADIIVLEDNQESQLGNLPWYKYVDKGLLVDLGQLMAQKGFDTSKYYTNIFDACKQNGKLYGVPVAFNFNLLTGDKDYLPASQSPTVADLIAKAKALPQGISAFNSNLSAINVFYQYLQYSYPDLVDTQNHKAHFDSPEFIQAMKDFKDLLGASSTASSGSSGGDQGPGGGGFARAGQGGSVAYTITSMGMPLEFIMQKAFVKSLNETFQYTNVPTLSGNGGNVFTASIMLGINATSKNQDAAWKFIETTLSPDIQGLGTTLGAEPVLKTASQDLIKQYSTGSTLSIFGSRPMGNRTIDIEPMTADDVNAVNTTIANLKNLQTIDPNIQQILTEELPNFFTGTSTAEDVAGQIQNRVNTILNE